MNHPMTARKDAASDEQRIARLLQRAGQCAQAGDRTKLKAVLRECLEIDPRHPTALYNLAVVCRDENDIHAAELNFRRAIKADPNLIDAYQGLADMLFNAKHLLPAAKIYEQALERAPTRLPLLHNLARTRLLMKDAAETERLARRILAIDDRSLDAHLNLAWALLTRNGDSVEALRLADRALTLEPQAKQVLAVREVALIRLGRTEEADEAWQQGLRLCAEDWATTRRFIETYAWLDLPDHCRAVLSAFMEGNPDRVDALKDHSALLMAEGRFAEAQDVIERASALAPDHMVMRMVRSLGAFRLRDYKTALDLFAARWHRDNFDRPWDTPIPEWDSQPVKSLLVFSEQGIGDYVMYALLFKELRRFAKSITIEVNPRVHSLFQRSFPDMRMIDRNNLPVNWDPKDYSAKVAMGDLPRLLGVDLENMPHREGFIVPEPSLAMKLRRRYQELFPGKRLVGISWRSGSRDSATIRSIDLAQWKPIFEVEDCAFISLQYGDVTRDLESLHAETGHVVHSDPEIDPLQFMDPFTAQLAAMDLIISVDNSTVHFAGSIGKPCWVFLPVNSDWRWLTEQPNSIWYDSLRLLRQKPGDGWEPLIEAAAHSLRTEDAATLSDMHAAMCLRCGEDLARRGIMPEAEQFFRWLMETGRHQAAAFHGIGLAAQKARHFQDAMAILGRAAELAPERIDYRADWAVALFDSGHREPAERLARDLTRQGNDPTALMAMGRILAAKGLPDQATDYFARVLRSDPGDTTARFALANLQAAQGETELARANYARLIDIAPELAEPHAALAEIDLRDGREGEGRANFAWRFGTPPETLPRHLAMIAPADRPKSWTEGRIRKRRLFLRAERTLFEQLLFAPWLGDVLADSRSVLGECDPVLKPLFAAAFPKARFEAIGSLTPKALIEARTQIAASLGDLCVVYQRSSDGWLPYDSAATVARRAKYLSDRTGEKLIGLSWNVAAGADGGFASLRPLLDIPGIRWLLLPAGTISPELTQHLSSLGAHVVYDDRIARRGDMGALAESVAALDLLIAADDLTAVFAGARARAVWKIAALNSHWSWLAEGTSSKWHPTARIFRGAGVGDAVADLREALAAASSQSWSGETI